MIRVGVLAALCLWLAGSAGVASAMQVTWTIPGTASTFSAPLDYFPNDSSYVLTITFETATQPTAIFPGHTTYYDGAIVAASFESETYNPVIDLDPPAMSQIIAGLYTTSFVMGPETSSPEHPRLFLTLTTGLVSPPPSGILELLNVPPVSDLPLVSLELIGFADPYSVLHSSVAPSSIDYSVPEPGLGWLAALAALAVGSARTSRRKSRCTGPSGSHFS